jgi:ferredoxin
MSEKEIPTDDWLVCNDCGESGTKVSNGDCDGCSSCNSVEQGFHYEDEEGNLIDEDGNRVDDEGNLIPPPACDYCDKTLQGKGYQGKKFVCSRGCYEAGRAEQMGDK